MRGRGPERAGSHAVRSAMRLSVFSIGWTATTSVTTVVLGLLSASVVLTAFGAVGAFDAIGSAVLVSHFRHALRHEAIDATRERLAQLVVGCGLLVVGTATAAVSVIRLADRAQGGESTFGIVVAALSVAVLGYLARAKRRLGAAIPSRALVADGSLSLAGCLTAVCAVAGSALSSAWGVWWVDPVAALCIATGAVAAGTVTIVVRHQG